MKKITAFLLASIMTLSLCSCWGGSSDSNLPTGAEVKNATETTEDSTEKLPLTEEEN